MGGAWLDPTNLRATCQACNHDRVDHSASSRWLRANTDVILVVGPPVPGLLYDYLQQHVRSNEIVIDYETIALSHDYTRADLKRGIQDEEVQDERNRLLDQARRGELRAPRVWLTSSNPNALAMTEALPRHRVVEVDPGQDECRRRVMGAGVGRRFARLVDEWYAARSGTGRREVKSITRTW